MAMLPNLLKSLFSRKRLPVEIRVIHRDPLRVTLDEWRSMPEAVKSAAAALKDPVVRSMLDILRTEHLGNYAVSGEVSLEHRAILAAQRDGYSIALNNFESLGVYQKPREDLQATFEKPDDDY